MHFLKTRNYNAIQLLEGGPKSGMLEHLISPMRSIPQLGIQLHLACNNKKLILPLANIFSGTYKRDIAMKQEH
jgi:hypothetical protein